MDSAEIPKRLCGEIQLFELCSLNDCKMKDGRFCTDQNLLSRFNSICDEEDSACRSMVNCAEKRTNSDYPDDDEWIEPELYRGITYDPED